ncbi:MAG TPA: HD domain-containing protein [Bryocella sp.]|nr:HD domain-containing protein [Bryocella sp.]
MAEFSAGRAEELLREWTKSESLVKHCLAVAACTESYGVREAARLVMGNSEADTFAERYRCAGLLHDFDYEKHPTPPEHPFVGVAYLRENGWPEEILHAILAHADYSGVKPETHLDRSLYACDELAGFLTACALVKPSKKVAEAEVAGVKKKMKDKAFARAVKREDITHGAELLGISLAEHVGNCLTAMQARAEELGL